MFPNLKWIEQIRRQSTSELQIFKERWEQAVKEDGNWVEPFKWRRRRRPAQRKRHHHGLHFWVLTPKQFCLATLIIHSLYSLQGPVIYCNLFAHLTSYNLLNFHLVVIFLFPSSLYVLVYLHMFSLYKKAPFYMGCSLLKSSVWGFIC